MHQGPKDVKRFCSDVSTSETQAMQVRFLVKPRAMRAYSQKIPPEPYAELATHGATDLITEQYNPLLQLSMVRVLLLMPANCSALRSVLAPNACHGNVKIEKIAGSR